MTPGASRLEFSAADVQRIDHVVNLAQRRCVPELISLLDDPNWAVRRAVVAGLAGLGLSAVGPLCETLRNCRDDEGRIAATVDALVAVSGDADSALVALAVDAKPPVLADIAQILGRRRTTTALATVIALSRHQDDNVAVAAIEALGRIGGRAAVDSLVDAVQSGNFFRAFPAIDVLGRSGDPRAVLPLTALLDKPQYVAEAARALGRTGDTAAVLPLVRLIDKSPGALVRLIAGALVDLHQRHGERFGDGGAVTTAIAASPGAQGVVRRLVRALTEGDASEQANICFLLGVLRDPSAASSLMALLDAAPVVAQAAANALRGFGALVEEQVLQGIRDGNSSHKRALLPILAGRLGVTEVVACLRDDDADVRVMACQALARMGTVDAVGALFPLLADDDHRVSLAAVAAIQSLGSRETDRLAIQAAQS
ncbi:MAG TPA: HEAT repeat domain-containing protein, partial [Polyangia bacterium]|nr:HEAT repeat domain-containing protein [Polyangia bacterium]